eukprot:COSAG05_NODE_508_length_9135_cov_30.269780_13_plen_173_part_00
MFVTGRTRPGTIHVLPVVGVPREMQSLQARGGGQHQRDLAHFLHGCVYPLPQSLAALGFYRSSGQGRKQGSAFTLGERGPSLSLSLSLSLFLSSNRILDRRCLVDLVGVLRLCRWSLSAPSYPLFWTRFPSRPSSSPCAPVSWVCISTWSKMPICRCWRLCIMRPCRTSSCR